MGRADGAVEAASDGGLEILLSFTGAPAFAEGGKRPASVADGAWKPSARAVGAFATALARRYQGQAKFVQIS